MLSKLPEAGQVYIVHQGKEYRRMVCGNYKIIYYIAANEIRITDVFDSRQDPEKQNP
jgi:plasmid stabilization system protein ParE